ncbi:MAG: hypothetical protein ACYC3I_27125 [Gemmataceae bacterium]
MAELIQQVFIQVGTADKDHPWYACYSDGLCEELDGEPATWRALSAFTSARLPAVLLYQHGSIGRETWGIMWGPMPTGDQDRIGRSLGFRLLVELDNLFDAAVFCGGALADWWPVREQGVEELGLTARRAVRESNGGLLMRMACPHFMYQAL